MSWSRFPTLTCDQPHPLRLCTYGHGWHKIKICTKGFKRHDRTSLLATSSSPSPGRTSKRRNGRLAEWSGRNKNKKWRQKCKKCVWRFSTFGIFRRLWSWRRRQTGVDIFFVKRIRDSEICYFCVASFGFVAVAVIHGALMMMLLKTFLLASYKHGIFSQKSESSGQSYYSSMIVNYDSRGVPD